MLVAGTLLEGEIVTLFVNHISCYNCPVHSTMLRYYHELSKLSSYLCTFYFCYVVFVLKLSNLNMILGHRGWIFAPHVIGKIIVLCFIVM